YLTLYAFSTENWNRPKFEVAALMEILVSAINKETKTLMKNGVKLNAIGDLKQLPTPCYKQLLKAMEATANNTKCTLTLAHSYSDRQEILETTEKLIEKANSGELNAEENNDELFSNHLEPAGIPDPELMIRTSGEQRISNLLLWQLAYSELYFVDKL